MSPERLVMSAAQKHTPLERELVARLDSIEHLLHHLSCFMIGEGNLLMIANEREAIAKLRAALAKATGAQP